MYNWIMNTLKNSRGVVMAKAVEKPVDKQEIVRLPSFAYQTVGALGIQASKSQITWFTCRDSFQGASEHIDFLLFYHQKDGGDRVINFIKTFEAACACPPDQGITFKKTSNPNCLWVGLSEWWKYRVRRSLLTALLRVGQSFAKDTGQDFVNTMNSMYYLDQTKTAVERFLSGHTACKMRRNEFSGWHAYFSTRTKEQIDKCLVKLKKKKRETEQPEEAKKEE